jgi:flagellar M-ring protein FliF
MLRQAAARATAMPALPLPPADAPALAAVPSQPDPLQRARQLARDDPKVVANVVKGWVTRDE